ncbi:MAG: GIY-YIG nuclease family protein [Bacteroidia bacterium]
MHYVYIIQSEKDSSFYIGYSKEPLIRLEKHNNSNSGYTSTKKPWKLVYIEEFPAKREALIREQFLKNQKSRVFIEQLIG